MLENLDAPSSPPRAMRCKCKIPNRLGRAFFLCLLLVHAGVGSFAQEITSLDDALQDSLDYLSARIPARSTVVILNFQSGYPNLSEFMLDEITSNLVNKDFFTVVDRRNLELLAQEMAFQLSGEVSDETALAVGKRLGAQTVISGAINYLGDFYRMRIQAIEVETARIQGSRTFTVQPNRLLATLTGNPWTGSAEPETPAEAAKPAPASASGTRLFYLGARGGVSFSSLSSFTLNADHWGADASVDNSGTNRHVGTIAVQASVQLFKFLAIQAEVVPLFPGQDIEITNPVKHLGRIEYDLLMLPILAKFTFRPSIFLLAAFGGVYFAVPWKGMNIRIYEDGDNKYKYTVTAPMGFIVGGNAGIKLGPNTLFIDIRYSGDFYDYEATGDWGSRALFRQSRLASTVGVEFGLGGVKRK